GMVCCILAAALPLWAILRFRDARTHVEPHKPTTALVVTGPYRYTRNPIYLGFLLLVLGLALIFANPWALLMLPLLWAKIRCSGKDHRALGDIAAPALAIPTRRRTKAGDDLRADHLGERAELPRNRSHPGSAAGPDPLPAPIGYCEEGADR